MYEDKLKAMELIVQLAGHAARAYREGSQDGYEAVVASFVVVTSVLAGWMGVSKDTATYMAESIEDMMERIHDAKPTS